MSDVEAVLRERTRELAARIKELNCVYRASDLLQRETLELDVKLQQIPGLLVSGLCFPEVARVLLEVEGDRYEVDWAQPRGAEFREPILIAEREQGSLHVAYGPDASGPTLGADERALVRAIATRIGAMLDRRRAEAERLALEDQLRQSQKMEAIGRLAGSIAHDFNNLLTSIKGLSALALEELDDGHPIRPDLEEIEKAAQRAAALTRQLLTFSRKQHVRLVPVDLNAVVTQMENVLRRVLDESITLDVTRAPGLPSVLADPSQLDQVVMNLVGNAQDALRGGGILSVSTAVEVVRDHPGGGVPPGTYALLTVRDTGIGISPDHLDKVFEPFFTTKPPGVGTGLGLATVFGIVKHGGGFIQVESAPGAGSTFRVFLPLAPGGPLPESEVGATPAEPSRGTETVLVAEGDASVRRFVHRILQRAGYRVLQAENAQQALEVARGQGGTVDLLLTDVVMAHSGGEQLFDRVRREWPRVRVLYMSGYTDNPVVRLEGEDPDGPLLAKPFPPETLLTKVRRALDREPRTNTDR